MEPQESLDRDLIRRSAATDMLVVNAERYPEKDAVVFRESRYTFRQFNERVNRLAHGLMQLGIRKGDRAAISSHNCDQFLIYWYALMKIGAIMVPVNWMFKEEEIKYIIDHSESRLFIVEDIWVDRIQSIRDELKTVEYYGSIDISGCETPPDWFDMEDLQSERYAADEPEIEIDGDDTALIIYTSGTESAPKGAMISHVSLVASLEIAQYNLHYEKDMVFLVGLPCFHVASLWSFLNTIGVGGTAVIMYLPEPEDILTLTEAEKATHWTWVTTLYMTLLQRPDLEQYDLTSVKVATIFGSYVSPTLMNNWKEIAPGILFHSAYGQTECITITSISGRDFEERPDSVGRAMLCTRLQIHGPDGEELPPGEIGEIVVRNPTTMTGYFKDEEKTVHALRGGWLHTGDVGRLDEKGFLYFVDRIKDMVKTGGENVASTDVEEAIIHCPEVSEVATIGVPHPVWQEAVVAIIVPLAGKELNEDEMMSFCKERLASYKVPKRIIFQKELPKSNVGKVLKRDLKRIYKGLFMEND